MSTAPPRPLSPIEQALALRQRGQLADAERILRNILVSEPGQRDAQHLLGLICHQQGRHVEALQLVGAVLAGASRSAELLNNYGLILAALERHQEALRYFEDALALWREQSCRASKSSRRAQAFATV